jgi:hypothetical protein
MTYHSTARRHVRVAGIQLFLREAAPRHAPVPLLRHGYPGSSFNLPDAELNLIDGAEHWLAAGGPA